MLLGRKASSLWLMSTYFHGGCNGRGVRWAGKVLVTVTVEGSPGPVRAMVRLGGSVEEAIGAVVNVYGREGRSPKLDPAAVPSFQLHHNHFCLQSLNKGDTLDQVGGRNFYLRRSGGGGETTAARCGQEVGSRPQPLVPLCSHRLLAIVAGRLSKIGRKLTKLWRALGCATCG
ncbi:hypothetical protein Taro_005246 [Colocasia esculenta]|uniref:DUF7054 domain-containing protein n=1 Tax=Colocasia esculenta TaxID=4460 RepID=A0A843TTV6_COLES|nr:hypothetical protein [Colocasia esculenta]